MKFIRAIKNNFVIILLVISSVGLGILALSTALQLRETRSPTPQDTRALTPPCSITFTITNETPREEGFISQAPSTISQLTLTSTPTPIILPTSTLSPTLTTTPTKTPTPTPESQNAIGGLTPTLTPSLTPTKTPTPSLKPTSSPTPTISSLVQTGQTLSITPTPAKPDVPISGSVIPTLAITSMGVLLIVISYKLRGRI